MKKEDFIKSGWIFGYEYVGILKFQKGDIWKDDGQGAFLEFDTNKNTVKINTTDLGFQMDGPNNSIKFHGLCENTETFELICKLIMLKI